MSRKCRVTRHDTGGLQEYVNKEKATEIGYDVVTQEKSSELPTRDLEGSEVQGNNRTRRRLR